MGAREHMTQVRVGLPQAQGRTGCQLLTWETAGMPSRDGKVQWMPRVIRAAPPCGTPERVPCHRVPEARARSFTHPQGTVTRQFPSAASRGPYLRGGDPCCRGQGTGQEAKEVAGAEGGAQAAAARRKQSSAWARTDTAMSLGGWRLKLLLEQRAGTWLSQDASRDTCSSECLGRPGSGYQPPANAHPDGQQ